MDTHSTEVEGLLLSWNTQEGIHTFTDYPSVTMWLNTTLSSLMSGLCNMVGPERFILALQAEGRKSVEADWKTIEQFPDFISGFEALGKVAAVAGWGVWEIINLDREKKTCTFRAYNNWEGRYQKNLKVSWGSSFLAGKFSGICAKLFQDNYWATQTSFIAKGDRYDEFDVYPSDRKIEKEINQLLLTDKATRADMAVALTRLKEAQATITKSAEQYSAIVGVTQDGYILADQKGYCLETNKAMSDMTGYTHEEILQLNIKDFDFHENIESQYFSFPQDGQRGWKRFDTFYKKKNGLIFEAEVSITYLFQDSGRLICLVRDVTVEKEAEKKIQELNEDLERKVIERTKELVQLNRQLEELSNFNNELLSVSPVGVMTFNAITGDCFYTNQAAAEAVGGTIEQLRQQNFRTISSWKKIGIIDLAERALTEGTLQEYEAHYDSIFGRNVWIHFRFMRFMNAQVPHLLVLQENITKKKEQEQEEKRTKRLLEQMSHTAKIGGWEFDPITFIGSWTTEVARIHDLDPNEYTTVASGVSYFQGADKVLIEKAIQNLIKRGTSYQLELQLISAKGVKKWVRTQGFPIYEQGNLIRVEGTMQDISESHQIEKEKRDLLNKLADKNKELEITNAALIKSNLELDDFAYIASHDLKEPLRSINNYSAFLQEDYSDKLDEEAHRMFRVLRSQAQRMEELISALLTYSRIGRDAIKRSNCNFNELIENVKENLISRIQETHTEIIIDTPLPQYSCDALLVTEIYTNLISNAMKYNEQEHKEVHLGVLEEKIPSLFYVKDNGIGIPEKYFDTIFRIFKRLHTKEKYGGGAGAGLTIVKKMINAHQGKIWLESAINKGTCFFFTLEEEK